MIYVFTSGCPLARAAVTSMCNGTAISGAVFNPPALEYQPGKYLMVVCNNVTKVNVSNAGHDNTTVTLPNPLPETLDIGMNCTGIMIVTLSQKQTGIQTFTLSQKKTSSLIFTHSQNTKRYSSKQNNVQMFTLSRKQKRCLKLILFQK